MSIVHITGADKSGKSLIANALRNNQIASGKGAILVDETQQGEARHLLEKGIVAEPLGDEPTPAGKVPWKPETMLIFVGDKIDTLDEFEELTPGITKALGPIYTVKTDVE